MRNFIHPCLKVRATDPDPFKTTWSGSRSQNYVDSDLCNGIETRIRKQEISKSGSGFFLIDLIHSLALQAVQWTTHLLQGTRNTNTQPTDQVKNLPFS